MKAVLGFACWVILTGVLTGCQSKEASVESITAPLATPTASASPSVDPRVTDLERIKIGAAAPDFALTNQDGKTFRLSDYRDKKQVVLVFYRGYFCGLCIEQLGRLKTLLTDRERKTVQLLTISQDTREDTQNTLIQISKFPGQPSYPLLEDRGHQVIDRYGILNPAEFKPGIPYPTVYVIGKDGVVIRRFLDPETYHRATNDEIREALKNVGAI